MNNDIFREIEKIIVEIQEGPSEVKRDSNLADDLGFDSLDMINFYFEIEKAFSIKIPEEDLSDYELVSIDKIIDYILMKTR